jgi:structural maintenance of chromosome 2
LTRFDDELNELDHAIKQKKQAVSDADLQLKKLEHDVQNLTKDKTAATNLVVNLENQHEWIQEEKEYVSYVHSLPFAYK